MRRRYQPSPIPKIFSQQAQYENDIGVKIFSFKLHGDGILSLRFRFLIILPIIYLLVGLFVDNLWRGVDSNSFSVIYGFRNYLEFQGEYFKQAVSTSPAYYRMLDFGVQFFGKWLDPVIAMRITNAGLILTGTIALYLAIRLVYPPDIASISAIATITCLGGLELFHLTTPRVGAFFAVAISIYGIVLSLRRIYGGVIMGFGFVLSIMMGGGTLLPTLVAAIIILFFQKDLFETKKVFQIAMILAISMMGITLFSFFIFTGRSAIEPNLWLPATNFENYQEWGKSAIRFLWICMPLWPALIGFRSFVRKQWTETSTNLLLLGGVGALCAFPLSLFSYDASLIILPFLGLLFAPAIVLLNLHWQRGTYWFNFLFFTIIILIVFIVRLIWAFSDHQGEIIEYFSNSQFPNFDPSLSIITLLLAILILVVWFGWNLFGKQYFSWTLRPTLSWIIGIICFWILMIILWQPAVNHNKSFKPIIMEINHIVSNDCIDITNTPLAFRVNWLYLTNKRLISPNNSCKYQLIQEGQISGQSILISDEVAEKNTVKTNNNQDENQIQLANEKLPTNNQEYWLVVKSFSRPAERSEKLILFKKFN